MAEVPNEPCSGAVLAASEITRRAQEIFAEGWEPENLRAAKYYVRIARDGLVLPDGKRHLPGNPVRGAFELKPGKVIFVSTAERFRMPWDLAGQISLRFSYAVEGALVLTGGVLDPGYGTAHENGERLHFVIANIGPRPLTVHPGFDQIAAVQFFEVCGDARMGPPASTDELEQTVLHSDEPPDLALEFFKRLLDFDERLESKIRRLDSRVRSVESGTKQIVFFGVFLLAVTLLGVSVAQLLEIASTEDAASNLERLLDVLPDEWPSSLALIALVVTGTVLIIAFLSHLARGVTWLFHKLFGRSVASD